MSVLAFTTSFASYANAGARSAEEKPEKKRLSNFKIKNKPDHLNKKKIRINNSFIFKVYKRRSAREDLNFYNRYLSELTSICNRINNHYDVTVHITDFNNDIVQVIFEYNPTIKEARFISWEYLKNYESEITPHLTSDLRKIGPKETYRGFDVKITFENKGDDYLVIFELEEDSIEVSEDGFKKYLSQAIENFRGKFKYESFTKEGSKYILKNFISINDILFKY